MPPEAPGDRLPRYGSKRVPQTVQEHDHSKYVSEGPQPARSAEGKHRQRQQQQVRDNQPRQPYSELKSWHRKPRHAFVDGDHGWIVDGEKSSQRLIDDMQSEHEAERDPRIPSFVSPVPAVVIFAVSPARSAGYSYRKAVIGSTRAALLAGRYPASTAIAANIKAAPAIVAGSVGFSSNR